MASFRYFIDTYGSQEPLGAPIGAFNQLSWLFPLAVGAVVLGLLGRVVVRSARRSTDEHEAGLPESRDNALNARLDDELRGLD